MHDAVTAECERAIACMVNIIVLERDCVVGACERDWPVVVAVTVGRPVGSSFDEVVGYRDACVRALPRNDMMVAN